MAQIALMLKAIFFEISRIARKIMGKKKMTLEEEGFLSNEVETASQIIYKRHEAFFTLCADINRHGQQIKERIEIHSEDLQELMAAILFTKVLEGFQGAFLLIKRGFLAEPKALMRVVLENLFVLKRCCEDREFPFDYLAYDEKQRLNLLNWASNQSGGFYPLLREYATKELKAEIKEKIERESIKDFSHAEQLAEKAGMKSFYGIYKCLSGFIHASPKSLERYKVFDEGGNVVELRHGPDDEHVRIDLLTLADFLILAIQAFCHLFDLEESSVVEAFKDRHRELVAEFDTDGGKI